MWTFSPSSEALLQRCIEAARPADETNKWAQKFAHKLVKNHHPGENVVEISQEIIEGALDVHEEATKSELSPESQDEIDEEVFDAIEAEPVQRFHKIVEECKKKPLLITSLAKKLSTSAVEKICQQVFTQNNVGNDFLKLFYEKFFPVYLKRGQSLASLDLLIQAEKSHPLHFKSLVHILLKDLEINSKILQDYSQTCSEEQKTTLFSTILELDLTEAEFTYNLFTIYTLYRDVKKTERIQNYVLSNLIRNGQHCAKDKHFGKLMLAYLQAQNSIGKVDCAKLDSVLEINQTPFKKPCVSLLRENFEKFN